jgi:hypothetical protein
MTRIRAIDPGSERSAWLDFDDGRVGAHGIEPNADLLWMLRGRTNHGQVPGIDVVVIEWTAPRGMPASAELFETLWWAGQFAEAAGRPTAGTTPSRVERLKRLDIKRHLCGTTAANDTNVRAALIDRFGGTGGRSAAVGVKAAQGPLYGVANDVWSALAIAVTYADQEDAR